MRDDAGLQASVAGMIAMNRVAEAAELAEPIVWPLSDQASFVSGCRLDVSSGGFMVGGCSRSAARNS